MGMDRGTGFDGAKQKRMEFWKGVKIVTADEPVVQEGWRRKGWIAS